MSLRALSGKRSALLEGKAEACKQTCKRDAEPVTLIVQLRPTYLSECHTTSDCCAMLESRGRSLSFSISAGFLGVRVSQAAKCKL
jgi:hypothetical protein